jgi:hypothetical protein
MNPSPAIGNTKSGIKAGDGVLWAAGSTDADGKLVGCLCKSLLWGYKWAPIASWMAGRRQPGAVGESEAVPSV